MDLKVNESKTKLTEFMSRQKKDKTKGIPPDITIQEEITDKRGRTKIEDKLITDTGSCKMLGVKLQGSLSWETHLNGKNHYSQVHKKTDRKYVQTMSEYESWTQDTD